ncbi:DUF1304 domain-containing protein [Aeromicrobium sp. A1-2]|uniref:DUF1304 domain-containing protein n=1 Tax=Aeromicrobium sp. A1-2 TaxID=2107713 RepID=UPI000E4D7CAB|nr:DUF1304 domain-containing protein [Aeromicrobium sp. A1-2]AXT85407.1 DUF1304 domain-containing protein [Aeromicrobium sp. A1-2]
MTALALTLATVAALLHVLFFKLESLDWRKPATWKTFGMASQADADIAAPLAFNQGFYNLFLALGTFTGIIVVAASDTHDSIGWTLIVFACGSMLAAAVVLIASGGKPFARAASIQGLPALTAVVASLVAAG